MCIVSRDKYGDKERGNKESYLGFLSPERSLSLFFKYKELPFLEFLKKFRTTLFFCLLLTLQKVGPGWKIESATEHSLHTTDDQKTPFWHFLYRH